MLNHYKKVIFIISSEIINIRKNDIHIVFIKYQNIKKRAFVYLSRYKKLAEFKKV